MRPDSRGEGVGKALLEAVAARVRERDGERLEWAALDWNELALGFYRRIGAADDERVDHPPVGRRGAERSWPTGRSVAFRLPIDR